MLYNNWKRKINRIFAIILVLHHHASSIHISVLHYSLLFVVQCEDGGWYSTDTNPNDRGDMEYIEEVVKEAQSKREKSCRYPQKIYVRKVGTSSDGTEISSRFISGFDIVNPEDVDDTQKVFGDTITGFYCKNEDQLGSIKCSDYEIKLCCPRKFPMPVRNFY